MKVSDIAKNPIGANLSIFIGGIQISACVNLITGMYFAALSWENLLFVVISCSFLGMGSFLSILLGSEVNHVFEYGEKAKGTTMEGKRDELMERKLAERTHIPLLGERPRLDGIRILFWIDVIMTSLALGLAIVDKFIPIG